MELIRGKLDKAKKIVAYGPEGIGKSTFASHFPGAVFCDVEGSTHEMDVTRTPTPSSWMMLKETLQHFIDHPEQLGTFVLDTADWAERLCVKHVCDINKQQSVESFGYGKGYIYVYEEFGRMLNLLSRLTDKGVHVVVLAHATLRKFEQPDEMGSYDRYELKLTKKTGAEISAMLKEWSDMLLFINYKTIVLNVDGNGAQKGKNKAQGGKRVMYTTHTPSWDAKNRYSLPEELPFDYAQLAHIIDAERWRRLESGAAVAEKPRAEEAKTGAAPLASAEIATPPTAAAAVSAPPAIEAGEAQTESREKPQAAGRTDLPMALYDLMQKDGVTEYEIMYAVGQKGYYPGDTPISRYDPAFVQGVLIGAWPQVRGMVLANREALPF